MGGSSSAKFSASMAPFSLLVGTLDSMANYGPPSDPLPGAPDSGSCAHGTGALPAGSENPAASDQPESSHSLKDVLGAYTSGVGSLADEST